MGAGAAGVHAASVTLHSSQVIPAQATFPRMRRAPDGRTCVARPGFRLRGDDKKSAHRDLREVLRPALRRLEPRYLPVHRARIEIVHDEQPRRLVNDNRMSLLQQPGLFVGAECRLRLAHQVGEFFVAPVPQL